MRVDLDSTGSSIHSVDFNATRSSTRATTSSDDDRRGIGGLSRTKTITTKKAIGSTVSRSSRECLEDMTNESIRSVILFCFSFCCSLFISPLSVSDRILSVARAQVRRESAEDEEFVRSMGQTGVRLSAQSLLGSGRGGAGVDSDGSSTFAVEEAKGGDQNSVTGDSALWAAFSESDESDQSH